MLKSGQIVLDEPLDGLLKKKQLTQLHPVTLEQIFIDYHQDTPSPQLSTQG
jgi:ABC-2 type transport system ATP-binding protein